MVLIKLALKIRNNWKKSIFFTVAGFYGIKYLSRLYRDAEYRKEYCLEAQKYGQQPLGVGNKSRKVTVFLNPAAQKGKAQKLFEKNVAPVLHLAGLEVTVVKTEYEGQAKQYMDLLDSTVDAIVVAGGNGTLSEVITGLLRRKDYEKLKHVPVGVIPLGTTNTLAKSLAEKGESSVKWMAELAMSVVKNHTKPIDVMCIEGEEGKTVYAVNSLEWGAYRDAEIRKTKYWYFGGLKHRWTYLMASLKQWPPNMRAELSYTLPCQGCSSCYVPPPTVEWRWWHLFMSPRREVIQKDYSQVINPECGTCHEEKVEAIEFTAETGNHQKEQKLTGMVLHIGENDVSRTDFIKEGWERIRRERQESSDDREVSSFTLNLTEEEKSRWFSIDHEDYESMDIKVNLLKNKLKVFCVGQ